MKERLAIRSDHCDTWKKKLVNSGLKGDLKPRKNEEEKSSWAHVLDDSEDLPKVLACRPDACRELQALALFIFLEEGDNDKSGRFNIEGVSVDRAAFNARDITEDSADHPIKGYEMTHRSLKTMDSNKRQAYATKIVQGNLFECWDYDASELRIRLLFLLDNGEIHEEFRPAAERLLDRWTGKNEPLTP